jgi:hypothetical protein
LPVVSIPEALFLPSRPRKYKSSSDPRFIFSITLVPQGNEVFRGDAAAADF